MPVEIFELHQYVIFSLPLKPSPFYPLLELTTFFYNLHIIQIATVQQPATLQIGCK